LNQTTDENGLSKGILALIIIFFVFLAAFGGFALWNFCRKKEQTTNSVEMSTFKEAAP